MSSDYTRKPYTGSCHCGTIKYIVYLTLPSPDTPDAKLDLATFRAKSSLKIYKCNCTVCHKMGIFHLRLAHPPSDFLLLSPVEPKTPDDEGSGVSAYKCNAAISKWYFCSKCGVRVFTINAEKEVADAEVPARLLGKKDAGEQLEKVKVWKCKNDGWDERSDDPTSYFSLNAMGLDALQEGLDLRKWQDWGVVEYCDSLYDEGDWAPKPYVGGIY
jgi:hypothetical protein